MKILLVSDTHGRDEHLEEALEIEKPDFLCHMGDVEGSEDYIRMIANCPLAMVSGNNDFWTRNNLFPDERFFNLEGKNFFLTHGHKYHVKSGLDFLKKTASEKEADIVLYGHTHIKNLVWDNDCLILNPGSRTSYGIIEIKDGKVSAELCDDE